MTKEIRQMKGDVTPFSYSLESRRELIVLLVTGLSLPQKEISPCNCSERCVGKATRGEY